jgi:hypothetical protein
MRGSAAFRAAVAPGGALAGPWVKNELWRRARAVPSLDLRFADNKSLVDATTGAQLVTFTRASSGTFVGSDGLIRTAVTNLLLRSEEFNESAWSKANCSITSNAITAPNGTQTADKIVENTATTIGHYVGPSPTYSAISGQTIAYSVFAKAGERTFLQLIHTGIGTAGGNVIAGFDLSSGTAGTPNDGASSSITSVGDGWYRCSLVFTAKTTASTLAQIRLALNSAATPSSYTGDGTSGLYIWGAQLEQSSTVGQYIPTTSTINSAPRFDHNPTTGESLGLLVEEARTNLVLQSEDFSTTWAPTDATVTTNSITAPSGANTADTYTEGASGTPGVFQAVTGLTAATVYTGSLFIKRGNNDWYRLLFVDNSTFANGARAWFNTATGAFGTAENIGTGGGVATSVTPFGDGWWRVSLSTSMGGGNTAFRFQVNSATADASATRVFSSVAYLWGAQLEAGAFPTSYIPTTTATVTRSADVASITGSAFSSWYRQDEGTVFADYGVGGGTQNRYPFTISDDTTSNRITLFNSGSTVLNARVTVANVGTNPGNLSVFATGASKVAIAVAAANNGAIAASNGGLSTAASPAAMPVVDRAYIGLSHNGAEPLNGSVKRLTYWPTRLPNSTLQAVTQ